MLKKGLIDKIAHEFCQDMQEFNELFHVKKYGYAIIYNGELIESVKKFNEEELFSIQSVTKLFTALLITELVEKKIISYNQTVKELIPNCCFKYWGEDCSDQITVEHLLFHYSGLPFESKSGNNQIGYIDRRKYYNDIIYEELILKPGYYYKYSNINYDLLGIIVENLCQLPFEQVMKEFIFAKYNMLESYSMDCEQNLKASSGIYTTYNDMLRFVQYLCGCELDTIFHIVEKRDMQIFSPLECWEEGKCVVKRSFINDSKVFESQGYNKKNFCSVKWEPQHKIAYMIMFQVDELNQDMCNYLIEHDFIYKLITSQVPKNYEQINLNGYFLPRDFYRKYEGKYLSGTNRYIEIVYRNDFLLMYFNDEYEKMINIKRNEFFCQGYHIIFKADDIVKGFYLWNSQCSEYFFKEIGVTESDIEPELFGIYESAVVLKTTNLADNRKYITINKNKGNVYLNRKELLQRCDKDTFVKANGEKLVFYKNCLYYNNIRYKKSI